MEGKGRRYLVPGLGGRVKSVQEYTEEVGIVVKGTGLERYENNKLVPSQGRENRVLVRAVWVKSLVEALQEPR